MEELRHYLDSSNYWRSTILISRAFFSILHTRPLALNPVRPHTSIGTKAKATPSCPWWNLLNKVLLTIILVYLPTGVYVHPGYIHYPCFGRSPPLCTPALLKISSVRYILSSVALRSIFVVYALCTLPYSVAGTCCFVTCCY